jgi:hypothetical protein
MTTISKSRLDKIIDIGKKKKTEISVWKVEDDIMVWFWIDGEGNDTGARLSKTDAFVLWDYLQDVLGITHA